MMQNVIGSFHNKLIKRATLGAVSGLLLLGIVTSLGWAASAATKNEPVQLSLWTIWDGDRVPLMQRVLDEFMAEYSWIKVDHIVLSSSERYEKFVISTAGGAPPDVMMLGREEIPAVADKGMVLPLDEYMRRDGIGKDMFFPAEIETAVWKGTTYILPHATGSAGNNLLYFNKEMFRNSGLDDTKSPKTWTDLWNAAKMLNRYDENGTLTQLGVEVNALANRRFFAWAYSNGGSYATEDGRKLLFNSEKNIETLEWMVNFTNELNRGVDELTRFNRVYRNAFFTERKAMEISGAFRLFQIMSSNPNMDLGVGLLPHNDGYESHGVTEGGWGYVIPRNAAHPEESWLLVKWLTTSEVGARWFMFVQGRPSPVRRYSLDRSYFTSNPHWPTIIQAMETSVPLPRIPIEDRLKQVESRFLTPAFSGTMAPRQVLDEYQRYAQALLEEYYAQ